FFAHTLVVENGAPALWPIDYYEWAEWKRRLEPDEDTDTPPEPLRTVALEAIEPSPSFVLPELQAFLRESPGRAGMLSAMVRAVFIGQASSRVLVVRDSPLNGAFWIACVQKAFPLRHALALTQSTYQFDTRDCAMLNATTTGTDFTFDETQRKFQFFMFDLIEDASSDVPDDNAEFASSIAGWMAEQPDVLAAFHAFMAQVEHDAIGPELLQFVRVFRIGRGDIAGLSIADVVAALHVVAPYLSTAARKPLLEPLARATEWAAAEGAPEELLSLLNSLAESSAEAVAPAQGSGIAQTWLHCFQAIRARRRWNMLPALSESRDAIAKLSREADRDIARLVLSDITSIGTSLAEMPLDADIALEWLMGEVLRSAQCAGAATDSGPVQDVIAAARGRAARDEGGIAALLRAFGNDARGLAATCATLASGAAGLNDPEAYRRADVTGRALRGILEDVPESVRVAVRRALDRSDTWAILFGEWQGVLAARGGSERLYAAYRDDVLSTVPGFDRACRGEIARTYAQSLDAQARPAVAVGWIRSGEVERFPRDVQQWCVRAAAGSLRLSRGMPGDEEAEAAIADRAQRLSMPLEPDVPFLRGLLAAASRDDVTAARLERLPTALRNIERSEYAAFLRGFLRPALSGLLDADENEALLHAAFVPAEAACFVDEYTGAITASGRAALPVPSVAALLRFWLVRVGDGEVPGSAAVIRPVVAALTTRLVKMSHADLESVRRRVRFTDSTPSPAAVRWKRIEQEVERRNRTLLTRVGDLLRRPKP
ncbi:MAG: hypothetical protein QOJ39_1788, partial [Candidatus Eremiobacteraeota bacterium]|nr:hypothetical protein [Candidatus Eremiobacteraeota bacterium]